MQSVMEGISDEVTFEWEQDVEMSPVGIWKEASGKSFSPETNG